MRSLSGRAVLIAALLVAAYVPGIAPRTEPTLAPPWIGEAQESGVALAAARRQGTEVTVTSMTTETRLVKARPDGMMSAQLHVAPVRTRRDGRWVPIDTTLSRRADGSVVPRATTVDVVFSGGGDDAMVEIRLAGGRLALRWPGRLPQPRLSGPAATYSEVMPGVDLVLRATQNGYDKYLVVKNAQAARNPSLARIRLGLTTERLTVKGGRRGTTDVRDAAGKVVLNGAPALMWDAAGPVEEGPGSASKTSTVGVKVSASAITLTPDLELLHGRATRFPVVIDPSYHEAGIHQWTKVFSGHETTSYWWGRNDDGEAKVGRCPVSIDGTCNKIGVARTYYLFDTSFLTNRIISGATLAAYVNHGPNGCEQKPHSVFLAHHNISEATTWSHKPEGTRISGTGVSGCMGPVGFNLGVNVYAGGVTTYFLKADDEGDELAWRRYNPYATYLQVHYNAVPDTPRGVSTHPLMPHPCRWCGGVPHINSDFIDLKALITDADNDQLTGAWEITDGNGTRLDRPVEELGSGSWFTNRLDLRNSHGHRVKWRVKGRDRNGAEGGWREGPTEFVVDRTGVPKPPEVTGLTYPSDGRWHGGVDVPGQFWLSANGVADIDHYVYGWTDPPSTQVDADRLGGGSLITLTPPGDGPQDLYVQSVDVGGNRSPMTVHRIYVRAGNGPLAQWSLEGNTQDGAFLGWRHGTLSGSASYVPGAVGTGLKLDGATGQVTASNAVRTDASFSASAWVKLDSLDSAGSTVLSQDGGDNYGFSLRYERSGTTGSWVFTSPRENAANPSGYDTVRSPTTVTPNVWTHLAATYESGQRTMRLYVDGALVGSVVRQTPWWAAGPVRIGHSRTATVTGMHLKGVVDEVKIYDRLLTASEVRAEVSRDNVQLAHWKFDEQGGDTAGNSVTGGAALVLNGNAAFESAGVVGGALRFGGAGDFAVSGAPVVRTDQSFTVAGWLKPTAVPAAGEAATAVSQAGTVNSGFMINYRNVDGGRWEFLMPSSDSVTRSPDSYVRSGPSTAAVGTASHVAVVYEASTRQIHLYIDGRRASSAARTEGFAAGGLLTIGRGLLNGTHVNSWRGLVDELRIYSRVVTPEELEGMVGYDAAPAGRWAFDGNLRDDSGGQRHGRDDGHTVEYTGGQSTTPSASDLAVRMNGTSGYVSAPHAVDSSRNFSVAAWARLDQIGRSATVMSQDGNRVSPFQVHATSDGKWAFTIYDRDVDGGGTTYSLVGSTVQRGAWTHLAAVYDAADRQMHLYVNGVLAASRSGPAGFDHPAGDLQIGAARWNGARVNHFAGAIDDAVVFPRPLFANEIKVMAGRDLSLAHHWRIDEPSGRTSADAIGARTAELADNATFVPGRIGNGIKLDGAGDAITTTAIDIATNQAFTVSAWVRLAGKTCDLTRQPECKTVAVSVDGDSTKTSSKFRLGHVVDNDQYVDGAWFFEMPESNAPNAVVTKAAVGATGGDLKNWVHLVGVYDPAADLIRLYVNGYRYDDGTLLNAWPSSGGVAIGRGPATQPASFWKGEVDDVRLYTGSFDSPRIKSLYDSYPAEDVAAAVPPADAAHWKLDENSGTTAADSSGRGLTATLSGGAGWNNGRSGTAFWGDGSSGYAQTSGTVLDTTRSFSAAAWVYLTGADGTSRTVLGQDGGRTSVMQVQYHAPSKKWAVVIAGTDADSPAGQDHPAGSTLLLSTEAAAQGAWTHLMTSYDEVHKQVRLYVNGVLSAVQVGVSPPAASGPFTIGRGKRNGVNAGLFLRGVDDVRVFRKALTGGEVRRVYDDVKPVTFQHYRFEDGTARDYSWRGNDATTSGGVSYGAGISGHAAQLDGVNGQATARYPGVTMGGSFTVSGWARPNRVDRSLTVLSQDGDRQSGLILQYHSGLNRWIFGQPASDADGAPTVYAASLRPPTINQWTHLAGVYDYPARQLRLYVDGVLVGTRNDIAMWSAGGGLALGRAKENGQPASYFSGAIDEIRVDDGVVTDDELTQRAGWPTPPQGQIGRYVNAAGDSLTASTSTAPPAGYRFQSVLGAPVAAGPNTTTLYSCRDGADHFSDTASTCQGKTLVGPIGTVYTRQPTNLDTVPIFRCFVTGDRFDSHQSGCEGSTTAGTLLGFAAGYGTLTRYRLVGIDHYSTANGVPPGHILDGTHGYVSLSRPAGTVELLSCLNGVDQFVSTRADCEGKTVLGRLGNIWVEPPGGLPSAPLHRCVFEGQRFTSTRADCEGQTPDGRLGYLVTTLPTKTAEFGS